MAYDRETKAQALALLSGGRNTEQVARDLQEQLGVTISPETIRIWNKRFLAVDPAIDAPKVVQEYYRLCQRYMELQHRALDELEESDEPILSHLSQLQVGGGISADKIFKGQGQSQPQHLTQVLIIQEAKPEATPPECIEGQARSLPETSTEAGA